MMSSVSTVANVARNTRTGSSWHSLDFVAFFASASPSPVALFFFCFSASRGGSIFTTIGSGALTLVVLITAAWAFVSTSFSMFLSVLLGLERRKKKGCLNNLGQFVSFKGACMSSTSSSGCSATVATWTTVDYYVLNISQNLNETAFKIFDLCRRNVTRQPWTALWHPTTPRASQSPFWSDVLYNRPINSMLQQKRNWAQWVLHSRRKDWISMQIRFLLSVSALSRSPSPVCCVCIKARQKKSSRKPPAMHKHSLIHLLLVYASCFHDAFSGLRWNYEQTRLGETVFGSPQRQQLRCVFLHPRT